MYTVHQLAKLANVTTRTLRYYDQIDLLKPTAYTTSGYRQYDQEAVERLQKILFYRTFEFKLEDIKRLLADDQHFKTLLEQQAQHIAKQQQQLAALQRNITRTLKYLGGETMTNAQRFEGFKQRQLAENELQYGQELREQYGDDVINRAYEKRLSQSEATYDEMQRLSQRIIAQLKVANKYGLESDEAKQLVHLHKQWICYTWPTYDATAHKGLAEMYIADERFRHYYDQHGEGLAQFLYEAIQRYV